MNADINYYQVIDDLRKRRAKLDAAISAIEEIVGTVPPTNLPISGFQSDQPRMSAPSKDGAVGVYDLSILFGGPYSGKTIIASTIDFLRSVGKPQHITAIINALQRGGLRTNSKSLYRTVYNTLTSNLDKGLYREANGLWGLKEWDRM